MTRTLVIHPTDSSTSFLRPIYEHLDATVITGGVTRRDLRRLIDKSDQVAQLGHGCGYGLFAVDQFPGPDPLVIDASFAGQLQERGNILIFCFASQFARENRLPGMATGMFISEVSEAGLFDIPCSEADIDESNRAFADIMGRAMQLPLPRRYQAVRQEYGQLAGTNPVAWFNHSRLEIFEAAPAGQHQWRSRSNARHTPGLREVGGEK